MAIYNTYKHPRYGSREVKVGFSWPAFFMFGIFGPLGAIWMLAYKLWGLAVVWFVAYCLCYVLLSSDNSSYVFVGFLAMIPLCFMPAFKGNQWRVNSLLKQGYRRV